MSFQMKLSYVGMYRQANYYYCDTSLKGPQEARDNRRTMLISMAMPTVINNKEASKVSIMNRRSMRERLSEKNGPHKTVFGVLPNEKYQSDMRFYHTSDQLQYRTGGQYQGEWKYDKKHGYGVKSWVSGNKYEGEWEDNKRQGKGTFWVRGGGTLRKQYAGDWKNDERDGMGIFFYSDGGRFEGRWESNRRNGQGTMAYANGEVYDGCWLDGKRSGFGSLRLPNGDRFEGHWLFDKKEGPGRFLFMSTRKIYEGEWVDGMPKCGEFRDMPPDSVNSAVLDGSFPLPALTLKRPGRVLDEAIAIIRNDRAALYELPGKVFTGEEMETLRKAFAASDASGEGFVSASSVRQIIQDAGISVEQSKVQQLLDELQAEADTAISLPEFTEIVAILMA